MDKRIVHEDETGIATYEGAPYAQYYSTGISHPSAIIDLQNDLGGKYFKI
ncbi:MAG: hypothetical protein KGM16_01570 [Bacteroidota bacterium]|nr:hypothetical protein [Bacteroidota bacterium]